MRLSHLRLNIKPLSVNKAWKGKRYRTDEYRKYQRDISLLLMPMEIPEGPLQLEIMWGFSNMGGDVDNPIKCFQDCLQKKYAFNDSKIQRLIVEKQRVKKGHEFIDFKITSFNRGLKPEGNARLHA